MKNIIVVGISAAGLSALSKIRELDKESKVTAITYEKEFPYNKCFLVDLLSNHKSEEQVQTKPEQFFKDNNINLMLGKKVVKILPKENRVVLDDGTLLEYDILLLATGLQSVIPDIEGINSKGVFPFYTFEDTREIMTFFHNNNVKNVAIVGLGLTGVEVSDAISKLGATLSVVEKNSRILVNQIDVQGAQFIQNLMTNNGIKLYLNNSVKKINSDSNGHVNSVVLDDGTEISAQMVIVSVGSKFDKNLFIDAGIYVSDTGVIVDEHLRTNFNNIYATGDIISVTDIVSGNKIRSCTWPDAVLQGVFAASNIVGQPKEYSGTLLINSSHFFDKEFFSCGELNLPAHETIISQNGSYYKICLNKDSFVTGFIMVGEPKNLSKIKASIINRTPLDRKIISTFQSN